MDKMCLLHICCIIFLKKSCCITEVKGKPGFTGGQFLNPGFYKDGAGCISGKWNKSLVCSVAKTSLKNVVHICMIIAHYMNNSVPHFPALMEASLPPHPLPHYCWTVCEKKLPSHMKGMMDAISCVATLCTNNLSIITSIQWLVLVCLSNDYILKPAACLLGHLSAEENI